jgi:hypothetical protein
MSQGTDMHSLIVTGSVPQDWLDDRERCREAGIPESIEFHPKWELALHMLKRATAAGIRFSWVVADTVYGEVELRKWLEAQQICYGLAIPCDESDAVVAANRTWLTNTWQLMRSYASGSTYQNYVDPDLSNWQQAYYGTNFARLQQVKTSYDPNNLFHFAQSIPPATSS